MTEHQEYTSLAYDTTDKYLIQDMEFLDALPRQQFYGNVAQEWWQLLAVYGHVREGSMNWQPDALLPIDTSLTQASQARIHHGLPMQGRQATLQPQAEKDLYQYLKQQLAAPPCAYPTRSATYTRLKDLHLAAARFAEQLNERIQQEVLSDLYHRLSFENAVISPLQELHLLHTRARGSNTHVPYSFKDGVTVRNVQPQHLRPLQFAGAWITLPADTQAALSVQLGFTDSRGKTTISPHETRSRQLTAQLCLERGYQQLTLDSSARGLVEWLGTTIPGQSKKRWLSSG